ncbi:3-carboxy-cis,cis-muconate cycloisomerase [Shimia sagamensis]|uniref:3-carboxy-cis,cis-muconate cycloisomerase n=1 Tax=Shimia sagamensis TaxID=1566352 RepID=A0ABY1NFB4_9RHOB|nr:3-carboxy-cis,cis-muconate cycloisomerase [Shimia sagamensis]SMP08208.1 3-carboxy-cis,cis-muconate cycloisomerase [Shimia sagamensis]
MNPLTRSNHLFGPLFSDPDSEALWGTDRFIKGFVQFERALALALADANMVPQSVASEAVTDIDSFVPERQKIATHMVQDGMPVPEFVRQLKAHTRPSALPAIHTGATSQDLIDTTISLILQDANVRFEAQLAELLTALDALNDTWGNATMMGRTRMQAALPISVSDRIATWRNPLMAYADRLKTLRPQVETLQFGGPVGNRASLSPHGDAVAAALAKNLGLTNPVRAWHATRESLAECANWLSLLSGSLGKLGQDLALMAQQGVDEVKFTGGGTSSAMPHKQNPVRAELLVTLARYNATQLPAMHHALVHEQERSGSAWSLEWMVLPAMVTATTTALRHADDLIQSIESMGQSAP